MEEDLVARMLAIPELVAILEDRVTWFELPVKGGLPCLLLTPVIPGPMWTHEGRNGTSNPSVQFEAWSTDPDEATAIKRLVAAEMERTDEVVAGGTRFMPPGMLEREFADTDTIGDINGQGGTKAYRWLSEYRFFCKPEA